MSEKNTNTDPKIVSKIEILLLENGEVAVSGSKILSNKMAMYGIIGCLNEMVLVGAFDKAEKRKKSNIIVPKGGLLVPR